MSEENKVYIEAYECLWEVYDPQFGDEGTIRSTNWRMVGDEHFATTEGTFTGAVVYEDLTNLLARVIENVQAQAEAEACGCDEDEPCSECPEDQALPVLASGSEDVIAFSGQIAQTLDALVKIAHDERLDPYARIQAADKVLTTYLDVLDR